MADIFGGMFDFNFDGKTDDFELALGLAMMDDCAQKSLENAQSSSIFSGDDDLDTILAMNGLSRFDLELMGEDERREALEDAGLDPDAFD